MPKSQIRALALFMALCSVLCAGPLVNLEEGRSAQSLPGDGIPIIAVGGTAGYLSQLYLDWLGDHVIFSHDGSLPATRRISGVPAGTESIFRLVADRGRHAAVCGWIPDNTLNISAKFGGFEDRPGDPPEPPSLLESAGNGDFSDLMFIAWAGRIAQRPFPSRLVPAGARYWLPRLNYSSTRV